MIGKDHFLLMWIGYVLLHCPTFYQVIHFLTFLVLVSRRQPILNFLPSFASTWCLNPSLPEFTLKELLSNHLVRFVRPFYILPFYRICSMFSFTCHLFRYQVPNISLTGSVKSWLLVWWLDATCVSQSVHCMWLQ